MGIFGKFIKERRAELRLTLCDFCERIDYDPSNWSKIERGILHPPLDDSLLARIAAALELKTGIVELKEKAKLERGMIPEEITEDEEILELLPIFMRTVKETRPSREEMEELIKLLRKDIKSTRQENLESRHKIPNE